MRAALEFVGCAEIEGELHGEAVEFPSREDLLPSALGEQNDGDALGEQAGPNLFHSFEQFSIGTDEVATFTGPESVENVVSRVTGGEVSSIDGTLRSTIPNADVYLLNPAGLVFGPNGRLDVGGSHRNSRALADPP